VRTWAGYYRLVYRWRRVRGPLRRVGTATVVLGLAVAAVAVGLKLTADTSSRRGAEMHGLSFTGVRARTAATSGRDVLTGRKKRAKGVFVLSGSESRMSATSRPR
jgi:ribosomal protein L34